MSLSITLVQCCGVGEEERMAPFVSVLISDASMPKQRKIHTPCHGCKKPWRAWREPGTFPAWA